MSTTKTATRLGVETVEDEDGTVTGLRLAQVTFTQRLAKNGRVLDDTFNEGSVVEIVIPLRKLADVICDLVRLAV